MTENSNLAIKKNTPLGIFETARLYYEEEDYESALKSLSTAVQNM